MSVVAYDYPLMDDLKAGYDSCAQISQDIADKLDALHNELKANYDGQAVDAAGEALMKIKEHLRLLKTCHECAGAFVAQSKEDMQEADNAPAF